MTQSAGLGLADASTADPVRRGRLSPTSITRIVFVAGLLAILVVALWTSTLPVPDYTYVPDSALPYVAFAILGFASEIVFVPIRHGDETEELTFFEVLIMGGVLVFVPPVALIAPLVGFMFAEPLLRRSLTKSLFNIGQYALAASALVAAYRLIAGMSDRFDLRSVVGLLVGALLFALINLLTLAWVLNAAEGVAVRQLVQEQLGLSLLMAVGCVGVATTAIALAANTPWLVPFALLPAAGLWYTYRASAQHNEASERNRWMVELSSTLSVTAPTSVMAPMAADAIRRVFAAHYVALITPHSATRNTGPGTRSARNVPDDLERRILESVTPTVTPLPPGLLPGGWHHGYSVRLELGEEHGALCIGVERQRMMMQRVLPWAPGQWELAEVDRPMLATLAASLGSAIRGSEHFAALRDETAKLSAVVDHATDGIAVFDADGAVSLWSPAMTTITGVPEVTALRGEDAAGSDALEQLRARAQAATGPSGELVAITRPDLDRRELEVAVVALDDEAGMRVVTVRDVTQQRRVERMKSDFIATVSHELRTPITPIKGYAQLLSRRWDRMPEAKRASVLATIEDRADHLSRLVDDLLLASRVSEAEHARLDVTLAEMDLADLVHETVTAFPGLADRITVTGTTATVSVDRVRAIQCLSNLIGNAGKYSPPESPIAVEFHPSGEGRWATVDVIDQGRGIPAEELDKVFERFYRVEDPMTMTTGGSGLGLFISRELARAMSGDITVESTIGVGSRFRLQLPQVGEGGAS